MTFAAMWEALARIGRDPRTGGYRRVAWTAEDRACMSWFRDETDARDLSLDLDGNGNVVAWWRPDPAAPIEGGVVTGSHLDSVPDGGAYDGPLGVVSALAALDRLRERGIEPVRPLGIAVFREEEGARFGVACLGSRLMTGAMGAEEAGRLRDSDGRTLVEVAKHAGYPLEPGPSLDLLHNPLAFVELHIEQGRGLADLGAPVGLAEGIWPHGRWRFTFTGVADHAGTTRMEDRADPMLTYAMTALAANKRARLSGARATFGRIRVEPNAANAVPAKIDAWLDARAPDEVSLRSLVESVRKQAAERAGRDRTRLDVHTESVTPAVRFDDVLLERLGGVLADPPVLPTQAGHDAGILATAGVPVAMLFVRNQTGVSHSPAELAETPDCEVGVEALTAVLADLLTR